MSLDTKKLLIIFSGLPASGKTTLASKLAAHLRLTYIRVDAIALGFITETYNPNLQEQSYLSARSLALLNLQLGNSVITDSINLTNNVRQEWSKLAEQAGATSVHFEIVCSDQAEHRQRLNCRTTTLAGLRGPSWEELQQLPYEGWDQKKISIETSGKSVDAAFSEILSALEAQLWPSS